LNSDQLNRGSSVLIGYPPITQDWEWIVPGVWLVTGPFEKDFTYTVAYTFEDGYGNSYSNTSPEVLVDVSVSDAKVAAGSSAMGATANAAAWAGAAAAVAAGIIAAPAAPGLFAIAAGWYSAAAAAGKLATDPPAPDPHFREPVRIKLPTSDGASAAHDGLSPIRLLAELADRVFVAADALSQTHGRFAARFFRDVDASRAQAAQYRDVERQLAADAAQATSVAVNAARAIDSKRFVHLTAAIREILEKWHRSGIPREFAKLSREAGLSSEMFRALEAAVREPLIVAQASNVGATMQQVALAVRIFARGVHDEMSTILAGAD
jgi:hypothetical protein